MFWKTYFTIDHHTFNLKKNVFGITASTFISCIYWNLIDSRNPDLSESKRVKENADYILGEVPDSVTRSVTGDWWVSNRYRTQPHILIYNTYVSMQFYVRIKLPERKPDKKLNSLFIFFKEKIVLIIIIFYLTWWKEINPLQLCTKFCINPLEQGQEFVPSSISLRKIIPLKKRFDTVISRENRGILGFLPFDH